jgi:hypothetical protein
VWGREPLATYVVYRRREFWRNRMVKDLWYKNAVIYCLSVATYMDANGDGIGDFQGLMRRLDCTRDPPIYWQSDYAEN